MSLLLVFPQRRDLDHSCAGKQASDRKCFETVTWSLYEMVDSR